MTAAATPGRLPHTPFRVLMTLDAVGGVWRYAMDLARALQPLGVEPVFAVFGPPPNEAQRKEAMGSGPLYHFDLPLDWTAALESDLEYVPRAIERLVAEEAVDLLHLNLPSQGFDLRVPCPVVVVSHSCVVTWFRAVRGTSVPADWAWQAKRNRAGFEIAARVIAPSQSHAALLRDCYGDIPNLSVVLNGSDMAIEPVPKEPMVFAAGRWWDDGKNGRVLDQAAASLDWPVIMAGALNGPNGQVQPLHHAQALGEIPGSAIREWVSRAAILASPSLYEPFGLAALEGARARAALVLADIPTYRELWDGAAVFADPRDPDDFATAIQRLAADPALRSELGAAAFNRAARFTVQTQADALVSVYAGAYSASEPRRAS